MQKQFHLSFGGKNAHVVMLSSRSRALPITEETQDGLPIDSIRICKGLNALAATKATVEDMLRGDPEINLEWVGRIIDSSSRAYYRAGGNNVEGSFEMQDIVIGADGKVKEQRPYAPKPANSDHDAIPVMAGKLVPHDKFFSNFVITRSYALVHDDGVKYEFLHQIAKQLSDAKSVALLGAGAKGTAPIIFQEKGKGYRCALYGKVDGTKYTLLVLVLGQELRIPEARNAAATTIVAT